MTGIEIVLIVLGVLAVALVGTVSVVTLRRRSQLPPAPARPELTPGTEPESGSGAGGTSTLTKPGDRDGATPSDTGSSEAGGGTGTATLPDATGATIEAPVIEKPEPVVGRLARLRDRLAKSGSPFGSKLLAVLSRDHLSEDDWDEIEETLLLADVGAGPAGELIDKLRTRVRVLGVREPAQVRNMLREELIALVDPAMDREVNTAPGLNESGDYCPAVVLMVGVNGTGKTTTVGKMARVLVAEDKSVVLGAADTFRAAAADQLQTWGSRVGVPTVRSDRDGADPASIAFDAVKRGKSTGADVVLIDTAGRLQNKSGLMDELGKIRRVIEKEAPLSEVLLVIDATTGQNGLTQARVFSEVADVTGLVLTKLDGTARGGIVVAVQRDLGVPVKLVGLGEGPDDLAPFDVENFVDGLLGE